LRNADAIVPLIRPASLDGVSSVMYGNAYMGNNFRPYSPRQSFLLPPSPLDWLPENHLAYFVLDVIDSLDLSSIEQVFAARDARGERPYSPRMLLGVVVYGYCTGVFSSRKLARATYEDIAFRVLAGGEHPHFTRINDFRLEHKETLGGLFVQVLQLCARAGLVKLGHVALDGTKVLANASKHKAMSYERMKKEEARLRAEVEDLFKAAAAADLAEDERYGVGRDDADLPEELSRRQARLERISQAKAELEKEAAEARAKELRQRADEQERRAQDPLVDPTEARRADSRAKKSREQAIALDSNDDDDDNEKGPPQLPSHQVAHRKDGSPAPKAQRNFTDPDSRIMVSHGEFIQGYNGQALVDEHAQVIVAAGVGNQPPDAEYLTPMLAECVHHLGRAPDCLSADAGYFSMSNVAKCDEHGVSAYLAVSRTKHGAVATTMPASASDAKTAMQAKLHSPQGRAIYARRKVIVEPVFGQVKGARGFRRFSLRGIEKVRCEWSLVCWTHNLLKLFRHCWRPAMALAV
jgi:transposase